MKNTRNTKRKTPVKPIDHLIAAAIRLVDDHDPKMDAVHKLSLLVAVRTYQAWKRTSRKRG